MTQSREAKKAETRAAILAAAIEVFSRSGYDGANFREITAICGAKRSLILYHFESKELLWREALTEIAERFSAHFASIHQPEVLGSDRERVRHALDCFLDSLQAVPEYGLIFLREGVSEGERMDWMARHFLPRTAFPLELEDPELSERVHHTVLRDIFGSSLIAFVALGPLLERGLSLANRQASAGVYPLTEQRKAEFVDYLLTMVFGSGAPD